MNEVKRPKKPLFFYYTIVMLLILLGNLVLMPWMQQRQVEEVDYSKFISMTENKQIGKVEIKAQENEIIFTDKKDKDIIYKTGMVNDDELTKRLYESGAKFSGEIQRQTSPWVSLLMYWVLPIVLFIFLGRYMSKKMMDKAGGNSMMFGMGKSNAKIYVKSSEGIRFDDVAGEDEAKENLAEIVEYLHDPSKYREIGASMPKGVLLVGPPGTGKTMLAKAVAGESNVPFFSMSGSEFVEMFVGMGASKVRDLFKQAKEKAPCIVFIDEIDAIGQKRDGRVMGNDEREQTLNQLLVEMDGFGANEGVIIIAATNRPDILDSALLRPGRFDRQIYIGVPDVKGRKAIMQVHSKKKPFEDDVNFDAIAKTTAGFTGADLENLLNEAALLAARRSKTKIGNREIDDAFLKVIMGNEKKSRVISEKERKLTAYHEAGHAVVTRLMPTQDPVHQISIVPRGRAGGFTLSLPKEDKYYSSKSEMQDELVTLLGGRVAEKLVLDDISTGASNDIERASEIARHMVTRYGMSDKLGPITYGSSHDEVFLGRDFAASKNYSEEVAAEIDEEVKAIIDKAYQRCEQMLKEHREILDRVADYLMEYETMSGEAFEQVFNGQEPDAPEHVVEKNYNEPTHPVAAEQPENSGELTPEGKRQQTPPEEPSTHEEP